MNSIPIFNIVLSVASFLFIGLVGVLKNILDISPIRRNRVRDEYKFGKEFLMDLDENPKMHPYLQEVGFAGIAGNKSVDANVIRYLLTLNKPLQSIAYYVEGEKYLRFKSTGLIQINFPEKYQSERSRRLLKCRNFFGYLFFATLAIVPLIINKDINLTVVTAFIFGGNVMLFGCVAVWCLLQSDKLKMAEKFINQQVQHTQTIEVSAE